MSGYDDWKTETDMDEDERHGRALSEVEELRREIEMLQRRCEDLLLAARQSREHEELMNAEIEDLMRFMDCGHRKANTMENEGPDYMDDICHACWTMMRHGYRVAEAVREACASKCSAAIVAGDPMAVALLAIRALDIDAIARLDSIVKGVK